MNRRIKTRASTYHCSSAVLLPQKTLLPEYLKSKKYSFNHLYISKRGFSSNISHKFIISNEESLFKSFMFKKMESEDLTDKSIEVVKRAPYFCKSEHCIMLTTVAPSQTVILQKLGRKNMETNWRNLFRNRVLGAHITFHYKCKY